MSSLFFLTAMHGQMQIFSLASSEPGTTFALATVPIWAISLLSSDELHCLQWTRMPMFCELLPGWWWLSMIYIFLHDCLLQCYMFSEKYRNASLRCLSFPSFLTIMFVAIVAAGTYPWRGSDQSRSLLQLPVPSSCLLFTSWCYFLFYQHAAKVKGVALGWVELFPAHHLPRPHSPRWRLSFSLHKCLRPLRPGWKGYLPSQFSFSRSWWWHPLGYRWRFQSH
jgi:hypothetical protein